MQQQASSSSPHSSPTPNASDAVLIPDRILAEGSIELSEAGHEGRSSERKGKPKPDLRPGLRMLFSKPVWQQEFKRKWQRVAPKVLWSLIVQERCTITVSAVFAGELPPCEAYGRAVGARNTPQRAYYVGRVADNMQPALAQLGRWGTGLGTCCHVRATARQVLRHSPGSRPRVSVC